MLDQLQLDGARVLDLATGTGAVAIDAARRGAGVVGVDLTPELLEVAQRRATEAGVDIEWIHDDFDMFTARAENVAAFDVVASSFGIMFAPDPRATAAALAAVTAPGGTIAICAWAATGLFGTELTSELIALMPPAPPGVLDRPWSSFSGVTALFAGSPVTLVEHRRHSIDLDFDSIDDAIDQFERWSEPWQRIFAHFRELGTLDTARAALVGDFSRHLVPSSAGITLRGDYVVSLLRRNTSSDD